MVALNDDQKGRLLKQVEFYFSDSNLPKDKFMKEKIASDPDGYVDLNIICAFARMKDILKLEKTVEPATVPAEVVTAAAEVLKGSEIVEVNDACTRIKRKQPLKPNEEISKEVDARSLYARPFPASSRLDDLSVFFSKHGVVNCVRMRRHFRSRAFKGSVFVEFANEAERDKVLAMKLEHEGATLHLEKKAEYLARKRQERKAKNIKDDEDDTSNDELPDGAGGKVGGAITLQPAVKAVAGAKRGREEGVEGEREAAKSAKADEGEAAGDEEMEEEPGEEGGEEAGADPEFTAGCILHFELESEVPEGLGPRMLVDVMGGRDKVRFVELDENKKGGYMRFTSPEAAAKALEEFTAKGDDEKMIAGIKGKLRKVEGQEEADYHRRARG
eukprot:CAMPEP_0202901700 /NCGR_PEP_ID=MMETSP1392-20130828/14409_1 /ASSEMBLY_ACC=CAM_ASM_000868 /TAXON_ID=225041 /ORGANISM="Chlamydomonas chlamydogama, Strain SAG 11-48b" /LENGTH=386 /DNA_ID=CAMNT_0049588309 /DNA_START=111 /DNA_END=1267 /DNA_ORIENTATION=-